MVYGAFRKWGLLVLAGWTLSCAMATQRRVTIPTPSVQLRSPNLNFEKIKVLCLFPAHNIGTEVPELSSGLNTGISQYISAQYPDWQIISAVDLLKYINQYGLGRGYQNYSSDLSTFAQVGLATPAFTQETKSFFWDLRKRLGCDAFLFVQYNYVPGSEASTRSILYYVPEERAWWVASIEFRLFLRSIPPSEIANLTSQSIAQNIGKGVLRQL